MIAYGFRSESNHIAFHSLYMHDTNYLLFIGILGFAY